MPPRRPATLLIAAAALVAVAVAGGCGAPRPWPSRVVLSLHGAAGRPVHGVDLTVALPAGASVAFDPTTGRISPAALTLRAGAASATVDGKFKPHPTAPSIRVLVASSEPLRDGALVAVDVVVTSSVAPGIGRFEVARSAVSGPGGAPVPGPVGWVSALEPR